MTIGGRQLFRPGLDYRELRERHAAGWTFQTTRLTEEFTAEAYFESRPEDARILLWRKPDGTLVFDYGREKNGTGPQEGDVILSFAPQRSSDKSETRKNKKPSDEEKPVAAPEGKLP